MSHPETQSIEQRLEALERDNAKLRKINQALIHRVEHGMADNGNSFTFFQISAELEQRIQERTQALEKAMGDLKAFNIALEQARQEAEWANRRLQTAIQAAEEAQRSKTRFFAAAGHDLLQPLNAARLFLATLAERPLDGDAPKLLKHACASLEAADDLINTLLELSRIDAGAQQVEASHFPLDSLIGQIATEFAPLAATKGLTLRSRALPAVVHSDWVLLGRILRNFLSNALRYSQRGGLLLGARRVADGVLIGVWDQGSGIPADKLPTVFQEFQRLPEHRAMDGKGMGLGLAIVERLAQLLQHRLLVKSVPGRGSLFGVVVPYGDATEVGRLPRQLQAQPAATYQPTGLNVLLIDNDAAILQGMQLLLAGWGCMTVAVSNREQALAALAVSEPDIILADYQLDHGETGVEVVAALCAQAGRTIPAALVTADRGPEVAAQAAQRGWELLTKPVRPARLRALIGHLAKGVDCLRLRPK